MVHLTYRPIAASTKTGRAHSADAAGYDNDEVGAELESQIPNNSLDTVTAAAAIVHRSKRSDTDSAAASASTTAKRQGSGAPVLPPEVSVQIKGKSFIHTSKVNKPFKLPIVGDIGRVVQKRNC